MRIHDSRTTPNEPVIWRQVVAAWGEAPRKLSSGWNRWLALLLGAAAWVAAELGRTRLGGNPFALLGSTQAAALTSAQRADEVALTGGAR